MEPASVTLPTQGVYPLSQSADLDVLLNQVGNARYVLIGEASHGTAEFYEWRAAISRRLIQEKGFSAVAVEGDWPDLYQVNRYVKGAANGASAEEVLGRFRRWPTWLWANRPVADFAEWLRIYNGTRPATSTKIGLYGLDVYGLWDTLEALQRDFPEANQTTRDAISNALACLEPYEHDEQYYGLAATQRTACTAAVADVLTAVQAQVNAMPAGNEQALNALQNAQTAVDAERYYRSAARNGTESWNLRDQHMMATIDRLASFHGPASKIIVWAHNTHVGDARYTTMAQSGMLNVGQLARQQHATEGVVLVGFGSYAGSVVAAPRWGGPLVNMSLPAARANSWEALMHQQLGGNKVLLLPEWRRNEALTARRGHRAIGVEYNPQEEAGNYVPTDLPNRYDAFLFIDQTHALTPLSTDPGELRGTPPAAATQALRNF
ncbi:protein-L-isoaspartate O-methyltransferase [Hymenobacter sp. CRA2]|nr:protein-L-isoaspartate O-methyltransferase [Hymenobacter sp. CRA2]